MVMMTDDLRSVLVETPGPGIVEDDKVGAGDIGLVLTLLTLYLQYQCQYNAAHNTIETYLEPYWDPCQDLAYGSKSSR